MIPTKQELIQLIKFGTTGVIVAAVNFGLLAFFSRHLSDNGAFVSAYFPSIATHFLMNKIWTFRCKSKNHGRQISAYLVVVAINFSINWLLFNGALWLITDSPVLANVIALPPTVLIGYLLMRKIVFLQSPSTPE